MSTEDFKKSYFSSFHFLQLRSITFLTAFVTSVRYNSVEDFELMKQLSSLRTTALDFKVEFYPFKRRDVRSVPTDKKCTITEISIPYFSIWLNINDR